VKIKSAKSFRFWYKTKIKHIKENAADYNENFVGTYHSESGEIMKGFFEMYHGHKPDIASYLPSILKIAEDGQAIYEFLQNAVDCNSTHFYIFYNEKYFLAINNGEPFDNKGLESVLNIAQTTKKSCDKIGRFGIGFKLVHRLVGKNEGVSELVNQYKGPILFSWAKLQDLQGLMEKQPLEPLFTENENDQENENIPYLLKLILTNFPAEPNETVKDLQYKDRVIFGQEELNELTGFLNENVQLHAENIKMNDLNQGSIFFLRLGEGKKEMLDRDYEDLKQGIQYSMNTLKELKKVYLNSEFVEKQTLDLEEFEIGRSSEEFASISPEYKECNIKVSFGYYRDYKKSEKIKASPNFYKYFPMGDETNGFSFIIHCDSFSNEANRRKLQKDSINKNLLPVISNFIITRLNEYKKNNREQFLRLYACLLLSDIPDKQNNEWLKPIFYDNLLNYLCTNIPTKNNQFSEEPENVKINKLKIHLNLANFGLDHIQWFEWESDNDSELIKEATDSNKLGIKSWDIRDIVENADFDCINGWIENQNQEQYNLFLHEIENSNLRTATKNRLCEIKLFKFSDNCFYSVNELNKTDDLIFNFKKTMKVKSELENLGFITTEVDVSEYENIFNALFVLAKLPKDKNLYESIAKKCENNELMPKEKQKLFLNFVQDDTKFDNIAEGTLRNLALFCNNENEIKPLCELVDSSFSTPIWIDLFKIKAEENFEGLRKYLISEKELYQDIILPNWDDTISEVTNVIEFYQKVKFYYDQDEKNTPLKKQAFIFINEDERFVTASDVFYNNKFSQISNYQDFQNAVFSLTDTQTPQKQIFNYLKEAPFEVKNSNLLDFSINNDTELSLDEVKTVLVFCKSNNENLFQKCTIEKQDKIYCISSKTKGIFQVFPSKEARTFIENNLADTFKILPYELDEYKEESGVLYREPFYNQLIESVDVDDYKTELIDIVAYEEPKRKFLLELSEIRFIAGEQYDKESFEYKILNFACDSKILKEADYSKFREKITIGTNEQDLTLAEIPPFADKIKIEGYELSLAKILPNTYQNSNYLSELLKIFIGLGLSKDKVNLLFNISQEPEPESIFSLLSEGEKLLENEQQLAFLLLYNQYIEEVELSKFEVETLEGNWALSYNFYINKFDFVGLDYILSNSYKGIKSICKEFPVVINENENLRLLKYPYFTENEFICPCIINDMLDEQKLSLVEFLFNQWDKKDKKTVIRNIDWTNIDETTTEKLLGFNPNYSVYPSEFALESEELPKYLQEWIANDSIKISFISDLGIFTEKSTLVSLRKHFRDDSIFVTNQIATSFTVEQAFFNTFEWLKEKSIELSSENQLLNFKKLVEVINDNRTNKSDLKIQPNYDFELLVSEADEWDTPYYESWKENLEDKFGIYLFESALPKIFKLDEIADYVFYRFNQDDIVINENNSIFINRNADIQKTLSSLISGENDFSTEDLLLLYQTKETVQTENGEIAELLSEVERLRKRVAELEGVSDRAIYDATVSFDDNYHNEIKEKSERYLFGVLKDLHPKHIVTWLNFNEKTNQFSESWEHHDFEIQDKDGNILHYIDCKGTPQQKRTFYLTSNEWGFFLDCIQNGKSYQICRVFNVESNTNFIHIDNLWQWIETGKVVPYLSATETIKGGRVFLTLM
jgi:hypothetical protein